MKFFSSALALALIALVSSNVAQAATSKTGSHAAKQTAASNKNAKMVTTADGLQYADLKTGTGEPARSGEKVTVTYVGTLMNGKKFDASADHGGSFSFPLGEGQVIKGWDEGVAGMRPGGERKLIIPADLGYGSTGAGDLIPPNATLVFDVKLLSIQK